MGVSVGFGWVKELGSGRKDGLGWKREMEMEVKALKSWGCASTLFCGC
jgi:hypothetical protein